MGIFDFLKKKLAKEEETSTKKIINIHDLPAFLATEKDDIKDNESVFGEEMKSLVSKLTIELNNGLEQLKVLDLEKKRENEKMKFVVKENLHYFINHLEKLISDLKYLNYDSIEDIKRTINLVFLEFERKSIRNYQKSTILIGEELGNIKKSISEFFKSFKNIIEKNNTTIEKSSMLGSISRSLSEYNRIEEEEDKINSEIRSFNDKIADLWGDIASQNEKIEKLKDNKEYNEFSEEKKRLDEKKNEFSLELSKIKSLIDFKALGSVYHSDEKKMELVKAYNERFKESFMSHPPEKLIRLIEEGGLSAKGIKDKIEAAKKLQSDIDKIRPRKDISIELRNDMDKIKIMMIDAENNKAKQEKIRSRIAEDKTKIKDEIRNKLQKIDITLTEETSG
jgi:hypothetical protein